MNRLEERIRHLIVETLNLEDIKADEIDPEEALFGDGLGLDSIDALEIGVEIQKIFGVKIDTQDEKLASYFFSVRALAQFVALNQAQQEQAS
ncbi:MAG TPA: phosphopantetheine-binding protein [Parvibaculum sp.]